jgi:hypothetical protein
MRPGAIATLAACTLICLGACRTDLPLPHEAYIWQREWTPALIAAMRQGAEFITAWRVLAAHTDRSGHIRPTSPDWNALRSAGRPFVAVLRIDRPLVGGGDSEALAELATLLTGWRNEKAGLAGLEIDYDSPTARLRDYADFLAILRPALDPTIQLSITVLPTWLSSPDLSLVLQQVDEAVLQVHSIDATDRTLFDRERAEGWINAMAAATAKPFRVALPAYGERLAESEDASPLAVEGEFPLLQGGGRFKELRVSPDEVAKLIRTVNRRRPEHMVGFVWFRLPTVADRRAWSLSTLKAVIRGEKLERHVSVSVRNGETQGVSVLSLSNEGGIDAPLPQRLEMPSTCAIADGANGYRVQEGKDPALVRSDGEILHEGQQLVAGWARCSLAAGDIHVFP